MKIQFSDTLLKKAASNKWLVRQLNTLENENYQNEITDAISDDHIYVCGMARSGTTTLLEILYSAENTLSYTYGDYPFISNPIIFQYLKKFLSTKQSKHKRPHGDEIIINNESPEAFEEILWNQFYKEIHKSGSISPNHDLQTFFSFYNHSIAKLKVAKKEKRSRYLAKNNYNCHRLPQILEYNKNSKAIVILRNPLEVAMSTSKTHQVLNDKYKDKPREKEYLRDTYHFEFGPLFRPTNFPNSLNEGFYSNHLYISPITPNHWLKYWIDMHKDIFRKTLDSKVVQDRCLFIFHEDLNQKPTETLLNISKFLGISFHHQVWKQNISRLASFAPTHYPDNQNKKRFNDFYEQLKIFILRGDWEKTLKLLEEP